MYIYSIYGWEHNFVFMNDLKYTESEFEEICLRCEKYRRLDFLIPHLKGYGFKEVEYMASFNSDEERD